MAPQSITRIDSVGEAALPPYRPETPQAAARPEGADAKPAQPSQDQPVVSAPALKRLMIEEIGHTGRYVYKLLDPVSGEVVVQLPREELVKMSEAEHYSAGSVIKTEA